MAHSKLSKVMARPSRLTWINLSYSVPQTSQICNIARYSSCRINGSEGLSDWFRQRPVHVLKLTRSDVPTHAIEHGCASIGRIDWPGIAEIVGSRVEKFGATADGVWGSRRAISRNRCHGSGSAAAQMRCLVHREPVANGMEPGAQHPIGNLPIGNEILGDLT